MFERITFLLLLQITFCLSAPMKIYEFGEEYFFQNSMSYEFAMKTETMAYILLKEKPIKAEATYVAIPWYYFLNNRLLEKIPQIKVENGFTVAHVIHYKKLLPLLGKMGVRVLFAVHVERVDAYKEFHGVTIVPFPHYPMVSVAPAEKKDILYSFIGANTHQVRSRLFAMEHPENCIVKKRSTWFYNKPASTADEGSAEQNRFEQEAEYKDVLARSRFSLCPRGTGANSLRFWESLAAGAIPVVLSNQMTFPEGLDWSSCTVQILEKQAKQLPNILKEITLEQEERMREVCYHAARMFFAKGFVNPIYRYFSK